MVMAGPVPTKSRKTNPAHRAAAPSGMNHKSQAGRAFWIFAFGSDPPDLLWVDSLMTGFIFRRIPDQTRIKTQGGQKSQRHYRGKGKDSASGMDGGHATHFDYGDG